jgi:hypothetical protein
VKKFKVKKFKVKKYKVEFMRTVQYSTYITVERALDEDDAVQQATQTVKDNEAAGTNEWKTAHSRIDAVNWKKAR